MWTLNWLDIFLAIVIVLSAAAGLRSGFARVIIGLLATVIGFLAGFWCYGIVAAEIIRRTNMSTRAADILGFLLIFVGVTILGSVLAAIITRLFRSIGLSWFDHLMGGVAGFLRGVLVIAVLADILVAFSPSPLPSFLENSRVLPYAAEMAGTLADLAPRELKDSFDAQLQSLRHLWSTPAAAPSRVI